MEYLRGMSLSDWLHRGHRPSVDLVLRLGREIAAGLAAAHQRGLVHRDIKPGNIFLEAPHGRVKILDFGLARTQSHDVQITNPGTTVGSPLYMAPEQARGAGGDASCDLFSLGCVLYELCTGQLPFLGTTILAVLTSLTTDTPPPPRERNPAVPSDLDALILRLLAKEPADRPPSAEAVVEAIRSLERALVAERHRAELPASTPLPTVGNPARPTSLGNAGKPDLPRPPAKSRAIRRALGIAAALGLLGMTLVALGVLRRSPAARTIAADRPASTAVAVIEPSRAVPEPGPPPRPPSPIAPPTAAGPPAETRPARGEPSGPEEIAEAPRKAMIAEAPRKATPDQDRPHRGVSERPPTQTPMKWAQKPADWGAVIDPDGDCQVVPDASTNRVTILVPGTAHLLSAEIGGMNSPRILHDITGDFEVRVRVTGTSHPGGKATTIQYNPYHGAGILLWQGPENYVRLEIAADLRKGKVFPYANFELREAGRLAVTRGYRIEDGSSYLRLVRRGDEIHGAVGADGDHWTPLPPLVAHLKDPVQVGVVVVNSASKPLKAGFEGFQVTGQSATEADGQANADRPPPPPPSPAHEGGPAPPGTSGRPDHRGVDRRGIVRYGREGELSYQSAGGEETARKLVDALLRERP
jgi:hypothetical protein